MSVSYTSILWNRQKKRYDLGILIFVMSFKSQIKNQPLNGYTVVIRGTLIQYQNKTWMELTEGNESIISIEKSIANYAQKIISVGHQSISGEIVDPKCFFGVMNPAYNKIHRSCAIRCISGGISPVLAVREDGFFTDYYFVIDEFGKPLNQDILQYVGFSVDLSGEIEQVDDWKLIKVSSKTMSLLVSVRLDNYVALCNPR